MIKKALFADELAASMQRELQPIEKKAAMNDLTKAVDYLHSALEIFEEAGMTAKADQILSILTKIANDDNDVQGKPHHPKNPLSISDSHTKGLTSEKMVKNLQHHGTVFNMADDGKADDLLDIDIDINDAALEVFEDHSEDKTFEDED